MIVQCSTCKKWFEDVYRYTFCPHDAFLANNSMFDGPFDDLNFSVHEDSYLSDTHPPPERVFEAHKKSVTFEGFYRRPSA